MTVDLQGLLDKINQDGLQQAEKSRNEIIETAQTEAKKLVKIAQEQAIKIIDDARKEVVIMQTKSETTLKQASRDVVIALKKTLEDSISATMSPIVKSAMVPNCLANIIENMVKGFIDNKFDTSKGISVFLSVEDQKKLTENVLQDLKTKFSTPITLKPIKNIEGGIQICITGNESKIDITEETVKDMICDFVSPTIVNLIKEK